MGASLIFLPFLLLHLSLCVATIGQFDATPDLALSGSVFQIFRRTTLQQCRRLCVYSSRCLSVNWSSSTRACQLKDESGSSQVSGSNIYLPIKLDMTQQAHPCSNRPCSTNHICIPVTTAKVHVCVRIGEFKQTTEAAMTSKIASTTATAVTTSPQAASASTSATPPTTLEVTAAATTTTNAVATTTSTITTTTTTAADTTTAAAATTTTTADTTTTTTTNAVATSTSTISTITITTTAAGTTTTATAAATTTTATTTTTTTAATTTTTTTTAAAAAAAATSLETTTLPQLTTSAPPATSASTATLEQYNGTCVTDTDCAVLPGQTCSDGVCICSIGYDMDNTSLVCRNVTECTSFGSAFTLHVGTAITGHNFNSIPSKTSVECAQLCLQASTTCKSFETLNNVCYLQKLTWFEVDVADHRVDKATDHYQRRCNW